MSTGIATLLDSDCKPKDRTGQRIFAHIWMASGPHHHRPESARIRIMEINRGHPLP